jgi:signal peptidase I
MKKTIKYFLIAMIVMHVFLEIYWLSASWAMALGVFWLSTSSAKIVTKFRQFSFISYPLLIIGTVVAAIFFKTLFFGIYKIPSGSMEKTISPGDIVWVNNLVYGPRLPYTPYEISWVNVLVWLWEGKEGDVKKRWWEYNRLKGYSKPKNGQVAVFNHPQNNQVFIKRIAAIPGDTLQIIDGFLYINGQKKVSPTSAVYYSKVHFRDSRKGFKILDSLNIRMVSQNNSHENSIFNGHLTLSEIKSLENHPYVLNAGIDPLRPDTAWAVYPWSEEIKWNIDNYGPYILPFRGMPIELNPHNLSMYGPLINTEAPDFVNQNDNDSNIFAFKHDYYFLMGDNFHDSHDSRYFGPVREEYLIGKASFILFSQIKNNKKKLRFFSLIN